MTAAVLWWVILAAVLALAVVFVVRKKRGSATRRPSAEAPAPVLLRSGLRQRLEALWSRSADSASAWEELEGELIAADLGVGAARRIVEAVREAGPAGADQFRAVVRAELNRRLAGHDRALRLDGAPSIVVLVGVNGSGKTTTVAKLAARMLAAGKRPLVGGADTFRAAADSQLRVWADRLGIPMVSGTRGGDPASVAYDALQSARARGADVLIVDTAGRLHTSHNLMEELAKIVRVLGRDGDRVSEVLLVMDATTGQSGLAQARRFAEVGVTGVVLTKLDGTAKGGVVVAIEDELSLPVKFVGVGEGSDDLLPFDGPAFVDALLGAA